MTTDEDEFGELADLETEAIHAVGKAANGTSFLVAKSAAEGAAGGLLSPEQVRELVAKAQPDEREAFVPDSGTVTMSGSPAALVSLMKEAAGRRRERIEEDPEPVVKASDEAYVAFVKAKYTAEQKRKLAAAGHAMRTSEGEPDYPIDDEEDLGKAIHAVGRGGADHDKIRKYVMRRAKEMGKSDQIPDNWAADGSLKEPAAVSKALIDGTGGMADPASDPGSAAWEAQDAAAAHAAVQQIIACIPAVQALARREGAEVGNGHTEDFGDVLDLQCAIDDLTRAAKTVAGFKLGELIEAGQAVAKAQDPAPQPAAEAAPVIKENAVSETQTQAASEAGTETVAKAGAGLTDAERAAIDAKVAKKAAKKAYKAEVMKAAAAQTSGAEGAPADTARTIPGTDTVQAPAATDDVAKAMASSLTTALETVMAPVVKQLGELTTQAKDQQERVEKAMQRPDDRNSPALNGATGAFQVAERDHAGSPVRSKEFQAVQKALDELPEGEVRDSARAAVGVAAIKARFGG